MHINFIYIFVNKSLLIMNFEIDYDSNVFKNRNLFYFNNYCYNIIEFEQWLDYNDLCMVEFESLNQELKEIYLIRIEKYIIDTFKTMNNIHREETKSVLKNVYNILTKYFYLMDKWMDSEIIQSIKNWFMNNQILIIKYIEII